MTVIELDAWAFIKEYEKRIISWINKALPILLEELKRLTPEDTREMLNSYVVDNARVDWNSIIGSIGNTTDYAIYVEYGVWWLTFNYHKPKGSVFYQWVGNRTFARAVDNVRDRVLQIILDEIDR